MRYGYQKEAYVNTRGRMTAPSRRWSLSGRRDGRIYGTAPQTEPPRCSSLSGNKGISEWTAPDFCSRSHSLPYSFAVHSHFVALFPVRFFPLFSFCVEEFCMWVHGKL